MEAPMAATFSRGALYLMLKNRIYRGVLCAKILACIPTSRTASRSRASWLAQLICRAEKPPMAELAPGHMTGRVGIGHLLVAEQYS